MTPRHFLSIRSAWVLFVLAGCATPYGPSGFGGGYEDMRLDAQTFRVSFRGNGFTSQSDVQRFAFYRCAELALQNGFDFFVLIDGNDAASQAYIQTPGSYSGTTTATATVHGDTAYGTAHTYGTYTPGARIPVNKYRSSLVFRAFRGQKPQGVPNAFVTREVVTYLGPSVDPAGSAALLQWASGWGPRSQAPPQPTPTPSGSTAPPSR